MGEILVNGVGKFIIAGEEPNDEELAQIQKIAAQQTVKEQDKPSFAEGAGQQVLQGSTFGFADEIQAGIAALSAAPFVNDKTIGQLFTEARDKGRSENAQFAEENPKTAIAANIAGSIPTGVALAKAGAPLVNGVKSLIGKGAIGGGAGGAVAGAGMADAEDFASTETLESAGTGAALGATLGAALPFAFQTAQKQFQRFFNKAEIQVFDDAGQFTDEAIDELETLVSSGNITKPEAEKLARETLENAGVLTPEQARRFNLFQNRGVDPLRSDITQATKDAVETVDGVRRGGRVATAAAQQDDQLVAQVERGIERTQGTAGDIVETNASVFRVVDDVVTELDDAVTAAYTAAREVAKGQPQVQLSNFAKAVSDNRGGESVSGGVISFAKGVLKNKGLIKVGEDLDINKRAARVTGEQLKKLTVKEAEDIRQTLNGLFDSVTPQGRRLIRNLKNALDDDVDLAVGGDIFADARQAKITMQRTIEKASRNKFDKTNRSFLEDVIDNRIPEEKILPKLLNARDDDFIAFREFLIGQGPRGMSALNDIKAQHLRDGLIKAVGTQGKGEGGRAVFNAGKFRAHFANMRKSKKFTTLYNDDEIALIDDIIEIGRLRLPPSAARTGSGPSSPAVFLMNEVLEKVSTGSRAKGMVQALSHFKADQRVLNPARETVRAVNAR